MAVATRRFEQLQALPQTLVHLSISRNAVVSLAGIEGLINLQWLDASCNRIQVRLAIVTAPRLATAATQCL